MPASEVVSAVPASLCGLREPFLTPSDCRPFLASLAVCKDLIEVNTPMTIVPPATDGFSTFPPLPGEWLPVYPDGLTDSPVPEDEGSQPGSVGARRLLEKEFANSQYVVATLSRGEASHRGDSFPQDDFTLLASGFRA